MAKYICLRCERIFKGYGNRPAKYCSRRCHNDSMIGQKKWPNGRKVPWATGKNNYLWKGTKVGRHALHSWIYRHKGRPQSCEHCDKTRKQGMIHWANKSRKYKRDLDDFFALCSSCHKLYDYVPSIGKKISKANKGNRQPNSGSFKKGNPPPPHKRPCICPRCKKKSHKN